MKITSNLKKYGFIILQALCAVLVSACLCIYSYSSILYIHNHDNDTTTRISLSEYRQDYYESELFNSNFQSMIEDAVSYAVAKSVLESAGDYDPYKIIYIGEYSNSISAGSYEGLDVGYYLKDLIAWGQYGVTQNGLSHSYQVFDSWDELEASFGNGGKKKTDYSKGGYGVASNNDTNTTLDVVIEEDMSVSVSESASVPMLDMITNRYQSIDGENLEYYATDSDNYYRLVSCLETSAIDLYTNYRNYLKYNELFEPDNSNVRFYISDGNGGLYTNLLNYRVLDSSKLTETFKSLGIYAYAFPGELNYLTNTTIDYDLIKESIITNGRNFGDSAYIWIGVDKSYPANDIFSKNYNAIKTTIKWIPWVVSAAVVGLIGFIAFMFIICTYEKRRLSYERSDEDLRFLDKLPVEFEVLSCVLLILIVYLISIFIFGETTLYTADTLLKILIPECLITFLYAVVGLVFLYGFFRRICCKSLFKGSFIASFYNWFIRRFSFVSKWFGRIYDSAGMAVRTWAEYIFFLLFNTFWACMLFFSSIPVVSFIVLLIFDGGAGAILFNRNWEKKRIIDAIKQINEGNFDIKLDLTKFHGSNKELAKTVNSIGDSIKSAVETSSKDEKLKADLITNVSHDIKTPLTSIINYIGLIKRENIENERVNNYIRILDEKSQRLKQLTIDLVEASKITSGNITLEIVGFNLVELINQAEGEFEEKFSERNLTLVKTIPENVINIEGDARYLWRIIENLLQNIYKYAMEGTRVYLDVSKNEPDNTVTMSFKNISKQELNNINADEITERFIRGDLARSTEGSGLGLSIVKSLVKAHNGSFNVYLDGDLFKATVILPATYSKKDE